MFKKAHCTMICMALVGNTTGQGVCTQFPENIEPCAFYTTPEGTQELNYPRALGGTQTWGFRTNTIDQTNSQLKWDASLTKVGVEADVNIHCTGTGYYGCYEDLYINSPAVSNMIDCGTAFFGSDPKTGTLKNCGCYPSCFVKYTSTTHASVTLVDATVETSASYQISTTTPFKQVMTLTLELDQSVTKNLAVTITVCGLETLTQVSTSASRHIWELQSSVSKKILGSTINALVTLDQTASSTFCTFSTVDFFSDSSCSTSLTGDPQLSKSSTLDGGFHYLNVVASSPGFAQKSVWAKVMTNGFVQNCKELQVVVCGWETVSVPDATVKAYKYSQNTGTQLEDIISSWFSVDTTDCPIDAYSLEINPGLAFYSGTEVSISNTFQLTIDTSTVYGLSLFVRANTYNKVNRRAIKVTICGTTITLTSASNPQFNNALNSGVANQFTGPDITTWFGSLGSPDCSIVTYSLENLDATAYVLTAISIDSSKKLIISTASSYIISLNLKVTTDLGITMSQRFDVHICGQEVLAAISATEKSYSYQYQSGTAMVQTGETDLKTLYSNTYSTECPLTNFQIVTKGSGVVADLVYPGSDITVSGLIELKFSTAVSMEQQLHIKGTTASGIVVYQAFKVIICGNEVVSLVNSAAKSYIYAKNSGTASIQAPLDVSTLFSSNLSSCKTKTYSLETTAGSAYIGGQVGIVGTTLGIQTSTPMILTLFIKGSTDTPLFAKQQVDIYICGQETITLTSNDFPFFIQDKTTGGGQVNAAEVNQYFQISSSNCPITQYVLDVETSSGSGAFTPYAGSVASIAGNYLQLQTTGPVDLTVWVRAQTATPILNRKKVRLYVCGAETISLTDVNPLSLTYDRGTGVVKPVDVSLWYQTSVPECKFVSYTVMEKTSLGAYIPFGSQVQVDSSSMLNIDTSIPVNQMSIYIKGATNTPSLVYKKIILLICGFESIDKTLTVDPAYFYQLDSGIMTPVDVSTFFKGSSTICPVTKIALHQNLYPTYPSFSSNAVSLNQYDLKVFTDTTLKVTIAVKAETSSKLMAYQLVYVQVCVPLLAITDLSHFAFDLKSFDNQATAFSVESMFQLGETNCPVKSYSILELTSGVPAPYAQPDVALDTSNQVIVDTSIPFERSLQVNVVDKAGYSATKEFSVEVCGNEVIFLNAGTELLKSIEVLQGAGLSNITKTDLVEGLNSTSSSCLIMNHELLYKDSTGQLVAVSNLTVNISSSTGQIDLNTTVPIFMELSVRVNSLNGFNPYLFDFNITVKENKNFSFNAAPYFLARPDALNAWIHPDNTSFTYKIKLSEIVDDKQQQSDLKFSSALGFLHFKINNLDEAYLLSERDNTFKQDENVLSYDAGTKELSIKFDGYWQARDYLGVNEILIILADVQGLTNTYSTSIHLFNAYQRYENQPPPEIPTFIPKPLPPKEAQTLSLPLHYSFAHIESIDSFGEVIIEFDHIVQEGIVEKKNLNFSSIGHKEMELYISFTKERGLLSDVVVSELNFTWKVVDFDVDRMVIQCDFDYPFSVSPDLVYDELVVHFKDASKLFKVRRFLQEQSEDNSTIWSLPSNLTTLSLMMPRQMFLADKATLKSAYSFNVVLSLFMVVIFLTSCLLLAPWRKFYYVINELQLFVHAAAFMIQVPSNALSVFSVIMPIVKYDFLFNFHLWEKVFPDSISEAENLMFHQGQMKSLSYAGSNPFINSGMMMFFIIAILVLMVLQLVLVPLTQFSKVKKAWKFLNRLSFGVLSEFVLVNGFFLLGFVSLRLLTCMPSSSDKTSFNMFVSWFIFVIVVLVPLIVFCISYMQQAYSNISGMISTHINFHIGPMSYRKAKLWKTGFFYIKRSIFLFLIFKVGTGAFQTMLMTYLYFGSMMGFAHYMPLSTRSRNWMGIFNEFILLQCATMTMFFAGVRDPRDKYTVGYAVIIALAIFTLANLMQILLQETTDYKVYFYKNMKESKRRKTIICLKKISVTAFIGYFTWVRTKVANFGKQVANFGSRISAWRIRQNKKWESFKNKLQAFCLKYAPNFILQYFVDDKEDSLESLFDTTEAPTVMNALKNQTDTEMGKTEEKKEEPQRRKSIIQKFNGFFDDQISQYGSLDETNGEVRIVKNKRKSTINIDKSINLGGAESEKSESSSSSSSSSSSNSESSSSSETSKEDTPKFPKEVSDIKHMARIPNQIFIEDQLGLSESSQSMINSRSQSIQSGTNSLNFGQNIEKPLLVPEEKRTNFDFNTPRFTINSAESTIPAPSEEKKGLEIVFNQSIENSMEEVRKAQGKEEKEKALKKMKEQIMMKVVNEMRQNKKEKEEEREKAEKTKLEKSEIKSVEDIELDKSKEEEKEQDGPEKEQVQDGPEEEQVQKGPEEEQVQDGPEEQVQEGPEEEKVQERPEEKKFQKIAKPNMPKMKGRLVEAKQKIAKLTSQNSPVARNSVKIKINSGSNSPKTNKSGVQTQKSNGSGWIAQIDQQIQRNQRVQSAMSNMSMASKASKKVRAITNMSARDNLSEISKPSTFNSSSSEEQEPARDLKKENDKMMKGLRKDIQDLQNLFTEEYNADKGKNHYIKIPEILKKKLAREKKVEKKRESLTKNTKADQALQMQKLSKPTQEMSQKLSEIMAELVRVGNEHPSGEMDSDHFHDDNECIQNEKERQESLLHISEMASGLIRRVAEIQEKPLTESKGQGRQNKASQLMGTLNKIRKKSIFLQLEGIRTRHQNHDIEEMIDSHRQYE